jgi:RHS repeat-associated protein
VQNSSSTNPLPSAISKIGQNVVYNAFDQPTTITEGNKQLTISYGIDDMRNYSTYQLGVNQVYTRYHLGSMDREVNGTTVRDIHYIEGPSGTIAIVVKENDVWNYYYTFTDPLGSILYVYNENGTINTRQSFDAWGRYRSATNWNSYTTPNYPRTWLYRGYTGHEMLPAFNLVNMNGRLYDPLSARMLSADPIINSIYSTQAYNRFSYVWNNPLKFVDPMGYNGRPVRTDCCVDCTTGGEKIKNFFRGIFNNSSFTAPSGAMVNSGYNTSSSGAMDAHVRLAAMRVGMAALSSHINGYIHQSNGYNTVRGMGLSGFATNQSSISWQKPGRSYSSDPMDYALAMGPPGSFLGCLKKSSSLLLELTILKTTIQITWAIRLEDICILYHTYIVYIMYNFLTSFQLRGGQ